MSCDEEAEDLQGVSLRQIQSTSLKAIYLSNHRLGIELWLLMFSCSLLCFPVKHVVDGVENLALFAIDVVQSSLCFVNLADDQVVLQRYEMRESKR